MKWACVRSLHRLYAPQISSVRCLTKDAVEPRVHDFSPSNDQWQTIPSTSHDVFVIHPKVRWGSGSASVLKTSDNQLAEAVNLVDTLPGHRVVQSVVVPVDYNTKRKTLFGSGRLESLTEEIRLVRASALFINVDVLSALQQATLHSIFGVPVLDRYNIVLNIFRHFARTEEARIQIELAEIPYVRHRIFYANKWPLSYVSQNVKQRIVIKEGVDKTEFLRDREQTLKKRLREIGENKDTVDTAKGPVDAVVAVVGYTNAGKTSLVKKLTGDVTLEAKDRLFATLDTTKHPAILPSGRRAVFVDTIGFLSSLPTHLIAAFRATLAHVKTADMIIHLRDVSNLAWKAQSEDVMQTLEQIGLTSESMKHRMITVDNKIDKVTNRETLEDCPIRISCTSGEGVDKLINELVKRTMRSVDARFRRLVLNADSPVIPYLYSQGLVVRDPVGRSGKVVFDVVMTDNEMHNFQNEDTYGWVGVNTTKRKRAKDITIPLLSLDVKCQLVGVTNVTPSEPESFRWHLKLRCMNCGESTEKWQYVVIEELMDVPGSRGETHHVEKCKLCDRLNTLTIVDDSVGSLKAEESEKWQSLLVFDCRGLEPFDFDPRMGWCAEGAESGTNFEDIDLSEKTWADYDEKAGEAVEINDIVCQFSHVKNKK